MLDDGSAGLGEDGGCKEQERRDGEKHLGVGVEVE